MKQLHLPMSETIGSINGNRTPRVHSPVAAKLRAVPTASHIAWSAVFFLFGCLPCDKRSGTVKDASLGRPEAAQCLLSHSSSRAESIS